MKRIAFLAASVCLVAITASASPKATVKVINQSKWEIHHMFLAPSDSHHWGPDQLGQEVIAKGETFTLTDIDCDTYDVKVVDEDADECVIEAVKLCGDDSYWKITDKELLECEGH